MKGTICRTIGKKGRTAIPFTYQRNLGIINDTFLKLQTCGRINVTPLKEFKDGICESGVCYELTKPKAVSSRFDTSAEDKNIG